VWSHLLTTAADSIIELSVIPFIFRPHSLLVTIYRINNPVFSLRLLRNWPLNVSKGRSLLIYFQLMHTFCKLIIFNSYAFRLLSTPSSGSSGLFFLQHITTTQTHIDSNVTIFAQNLHFIIPVEVSTLVYIIIHN